MSKLDPSRWAAPLHMDPGPHAPKIVRVFVEVPMRSRNKYEIDKASGLIALDRHLYSSSHYPGDYGFIPGTYADDGDSLDAVVMLHDPTFSGCLIDMRPVGLFRMRDGGKEDLKILGVPNKDPLYEDVHDLDDVPKHYLREVEHFFSTYKQLEGVTVETNGWGARAEAEAAIVAAVRDFKGRTMLR
jgi:inorganic pyrophosphatase